MIRRVVAALPPGLVRFFGTLQFKLPFLRRAIQAAARRFAASEGVIRRGVGAGLRFDATGGAAGNLLGTTEPLEQELLARLLRPGDTFYDVGANIGFYSTIAARLVGPTGQVYAFEPFGASAAMAQRNAELNGFAHVTVIEAAVTDHPGTIRLEVRDGSVQHRIARGDAADGPEIEAISIDDYMSRHELRIPGVVMIDVEGAELEVLRGMLATIRTHRPVIMCEVHWKGHVFEEFVGRELTPLGYTATTYAGDPFPQEISRYHALLTPSRS